MGFSPIGEMPTGHLADAKRIGEMPTGHLADAKRIGEMPTGHLADFMGFPTFPVISPDG